MQFSSSGTASPHPQASIPDEKNGRRRPVLQSLAFFLLLAAALATRLPSPWRLEITNDEQHHHLQSWRNRYRTNDVFPVFFDRLQQTHQNSRFVRSLLVIYHAHPELVARTLFILIDPQPPLWPVLAETIEALSHSSLVLQRIPSLIASLSALALAYLIGKQLAGIDLGLWLASLFTIGLLSQVYAGIARPYALAQCLLLALIYTFIRQRQQHAQKISLFLLVALLAQSAQWMAWAIIAPLVAVELFCQYQNTRSLRRLIARTWWYAIASALLLIEMAVQLHNPTISNQAHRPDRSEILRAIAWASPFSQLLVMSRPLQWLSIALFLLLLMVAVACLLLRPKIIPDKFIRLALILALISSLVAPMLLGASVRFLMTYLVVPTLFAALAVYCLLASQFLRRAFLIIALLFFGALSMIHLQHPYQYKIWPEPRFSIIARDLKSQLQPGDLWAGYPYFIADDLYRYGPWPDPLLPQSDDEFIKDVHDSWQKGHAVYVLTSSNQLPALIPRQQIIKKYQEQEFVIYLIKLPP